MISCLSYCVNTVLLSFVPMRYRAEGLVSSLVGLFDFCSYMGAALSTYVLGGMVNAQGVQGMALVWIAAACGGSALLVLARRRQAA